MKRVIFASFLLVAGPAFAQSDDEFRKGFLDMFANGCFAEQRKATTSAQLSDDAIKNYCACFSQQIPGAVTVQEMRQIGATGAMTPAVQSRLTAIGKSCLDRLKQ